MKKTKAKQKKEKNEKHMFLQHSNVAYFTIL